MKNVIEFKSRQKATNNQPQPAKQTAAADLAPIVDMVEKRQEILSRERRQVKRTILSEFVGAFVVLPEKGLMKVTLFDISENGLAFDMDASKGSFAVGEEVAMRVYLNQQTYFPFIVRMQNARIVADEQISRHGGHFVKDTINDQALFHFVKFIETVSASLKKDDGDVMVSNLTR